MVKPKIAKKEWYPILAPKIFQNAVLGETPVYDPQNMIGKGLTTNLMNLTRDIKRQNVNVNFRIVDVQNGKAFTDIIGYYMAPSSVKRLIRKNISKISMSFSCKTSDNKTLQVKPLLITRAATIGSVATKMRRNSQDFLIKYIASITYDNLINDMVNHKMQSSLKREMNKIYPLRVCEIRSMEIVDLEKKKEAKEAKAAKKEKHSKEAGSEAAGKKEVKDTQKKEEKQEEVKENKEAAKEEKQAEVKESKEETKPEVKEEPKPETKPEQTA